MLTITWIKFLIASILLKKILREKSKRRSIKCIKVIVLILVLFEFLICAFLNILTTVIPSVITVVSMLTVGYYF